MPEGFPIVGQQSDMLEGSALVNVPLPETWIKGTLKLQAQVYPSTLADLQKGLEDLLREPNGCFEQTSTSNYPNLLDPRLPARKRPGKPEIERRAPRLAGTRLSEADLVRVPELAARTSARATSGSAAPPRPTRP